MVYILGITVVATQLGRVASAVTAVMCAAALDFFFVIPRFGFVPPDLKYMVTVFGLFLLGLVISTLTARLQDQVEVARREQRRTAALLSLSRELAETQSIDLLALTAAEHVRQFFISPALVFLPRPDGSLGPVTQESKKSGVTDFESSRASWYAAANQALGRASGEQLTVADRQDKVAVAMNASRGIVGVIAIDVGDLMLTAEEALQLEAFAAQTGMAIERAQLKAEAEKSRVAAETERVRNALLSSVSHDLRTPLGAITGASSALLEDEKLIDSPLGRDLLTTVYEEADRLNRLVGSLLDMTRLEGGAVVPHKEWQPLEEVIGAALTRRSLQLAKHQVTVRMDYALPLVNVDSVLLEQALGNILDNAAVHTPAGTEVEVEALSVPGGIEIRVADRGAGLASGEEDRVFDKFYRGSGAGHPTGAGLGLAVSRGIIEVHGGRVWAENREGGGVIFHIFLPSEEIPPGLSLAQGQDEEPEEEE